jgi:hypothetical protein
MPIVTASSFADRADLAAFQHAKALGWSDKHAFAVGDNGVGAWGDFTARDDVPMCALPRKTGLHNGKAQLWLVEKKWLLPTTGKLF